MKVIPTILPNRGPIKIVPLADLHLGSPKCDIPRIKQVIKDIADDPDTFAIIVGDVLNNSTKTSVGDVYNEALSPMQQAQLAVELFTPIKDKILGITMGNHCARSLKGDGLDILYFIAVELDIEDKYDPDGAVLLVRFGKTPDPTKGNKTCYSIYINHGTGVSGSTMGGKANGLEKRGNIVNADVVCIGHTHSPMTFKTASYVIDEHNNNLILKETVFVNTGAWLAYESYAEKMGLKPSSTAMPIIILHPKRTSKDRKFIEVHL